MKVVTFNIRYDCGKDGKNNFCFRKPLILQKLALEHPQVVCFQEVLPHVARWLKESLPEYTVVGCGRSESLEDEQVSIAFHKDRFNLIQMDTFWLSPTPEIPGSRFPVQSPCPRVCTLALLEDLQGKKVFRVANTHLDHEGAPARRQGLRLILRRLQGADLFPDAPVIFAGDFNMPPDSGELDVFREFDGYENVTENIGVTYHGFGRAWRKTQIDYLFLKGAVRSLHAERWTDVRDGVYLSDHYPVCAELVLEGGIG